MHPCRECGKAVETTAQFCPWCFALPHTTTTPAPAAPTAAWAAPVTPSRWPQVLLIGGILALVLGLLLGVTALGG